MGLILAGLCLSIPLFSSDGAVCSPEAQYEECRCSECMTWDPVPGALAYHIHRQTVSTGDVIDAGRLTSWEMCETVLVPCVTTVITFGGIPVLSTSDAACEDGLQPETSCWVEGPPTVWCFARDSSFPREGTLYQYAIAAENEAGTGPFSDAVFYRAAPYACYEDGREVQCYTGDDIASR